MEFENLPEGWRKDKLINLTTKIGSGATPKGGSDVYLENGEIALIRSQNIYNLSFSPDGLAYIEQHQANKLANVEVRKDDVLLNITGDSVARACLVPDSYLPARVNQHVAILRTNSEKLNARYLQYFLVNPTMQMHMLNLSSAGATRKALTKGMIEDFTIPIPPLPQQQKIASILGALDDKIELNNQMNQTLKAMAKALFKSWFVDFEPFADGEFKESEMGMIPKGWKITQISNLIPIADGTHDSPKQQETGFPLITSKHIKNNRIKIEEAYLISAEDCMKVNQRSKVDKFDILITMIGTVGEICFVLEDEINFAIKNVGLFKSSKNRQYFEFIYLHLKSDYAQEYIHSHQSGTTQQYLTLTSLRQFPIIVPSDEVLQRFRTIVEPIFTRISTNQREIERMTAIRDSLLPKLMSGEIEV